MGCRTMFWHVDDHRLGIDEIKGRSADHLARAAEKVVQGKIPVADLLLLQQALKHVYVSSLVTVCFRLYKSYRIGSQRQTIPYGGV